MNAESTSPRLSASMVVVDPPLLRTRAAAISMLGITAIAVGWIALTVFRAFTDGWVAPLQLSPDNDQVIQLRLRLERHRGELERLDAELVRLDGEIASVDAAVERLSTMQTHGRDTLTWQESATGDEQGVVQQTLAHLTTQRRLLKRLIGRQRTLTDAARADLAAGIIDRTELQKQEQALDHLALQLADNARQIDDAKAHLELATSARSAYRAGLDDAPTTQQSGRMPEVAASEERDARIEIELIRLGGERRGLAALRAVVTQQVASERALLEEIKSRPIYRAIEARTDVAFVPYEQMDNVRAGAPLLACTWSLFLCEEVGQISEVLPGEVVSQDPWGEIARGRYAILQLDEPDAVREKVLRVR